MFIAVILAYQSPSASVRINIMSLSIGIVGLPNVGKSTLFNALTNNQVLAANYPFATIEPNSGVVPIPDSRLTELSKLYSNAPIKPATVDFVDIAGLVAGASNGEGLGNQFLSHIRSTSAICHVVRAFENTDIVHVDEHPNPKKDIEVINTELILADLQTVESRLPKLAKEAKSNPKLSKQVEELKRIQILLNEGKMLSSVNDLSIEDFSDLHLLTAKPIIYVFNVDEAGLTDEKLKSELASLVAPQKCLFVCAELEVQLQQLDESDAKELLGSYGQDESSLNKLIHASYDLLGLQSYMTAGIKEVRSWTIKKGSSAPQAAGVIHTDFERGFIAAEVVSYSDLIESGGLAQARSLGKVRTEGKDYNVQPDDVIEFRFNV